MSRQFTFEWLSIVLLLLVCTQTMAQSKRPEQAVMDSFQEPSNVVPVEVVNVTDTVHIEKSMTDKVRPVIKRWLKFNNIEPSEFKLSETGTINLTELTQDRSSIYHREFLASDDVYIPQLHDYSPDKRYYLNLLSTAGVYKEKGKYHYSGGDDSQEIYLIDRKNKTWALVAWLGASSSTSAVFWIDNNTFALVGMDFNNKPLFTLSVFDLKESKSFYYVLPNLNNQTKSYFRDVNLKSRNIIIDQ